MSPSAGPITLPFTLRFDHILLDARINGVPATLALDTGSGACGLDADWASGLGMLPGRATQAVGVDNVAISLATIDTLHLGDHVELRNEIAALVPLRDVSAKHGRRIHGTIGFPFFMKYVVEIDYAARVIRLHDPATFVYDGPSERIPLELSMRVPLLSAELTGRNGATMPARLLLDLGTGGFGSVLTQPFADRNAESLSAGPVLDRAIGAGVGGSLHARVTMLGSLRVGDLRVPNPIVALPDDGRGFFGVSWADGTLGAPILRRTRLILDYAHAHVIMEPVEPMDAPFSYNASGVSLRANGPDLEAVVIDGVAPGSAGANAGLVAGEILCAVNTRPVSAASLEWVSDLFAQAGASHMLRVGAGGTDRDVVLRLGSSALL